MKFFIALALFAVASAAVLPPAAVVSDNPEMQEILAAIQSPSTDPATAAALEQMLLQILGLAQPEPIHVGPAIVDPSPIVIGPAIVDNYEPISIGPALVDFPLSDGGVVTEVNPAPVMPAPVGPSASAPLVQIILNIKSASNALPSPVIVPEPVIVVDQPIVPEPVIIVDQPIVPEPVIVVDQPIVSEPVIVVEQPIIPEPVIVVEQPIIPAPVITLPDILN